MKKTSPSQNNRAICIIFVLTLCVLIGLHPTQIAQADGAPPPEPDIGGVAPYQPIETNVQMMSETVLIDVLPHPTRWTSTEFTWNQNIVRVSASFTLRNQGIEEEKMQVIFPLTRLDYPWLASSYNIIGSSFVAIVNGKTVPTTVVSTPPELQAMPEGIDSELPDGFFIPNVQWAGFDVTFPVNEDVIVQVEYDMWGDTATGLHHVDYILETGAGWYGNILSADFIVRFPYPATSVSVPEKPNNCVFSGNEVHCQMKNFEPKRKDNLSFGFIDTNEWPPTLELVSRVEHYPDDADAWYKLANRYERLGFWQGPGGTSVRAENFVDLSIEAFEKAIDLNYEWGDAHFGLARVLWRSKLKLASTGNEKLSEDDPMVQRVLLEMQLAASYGFKDGYYSYDNISYEILRAIPDLEESILPTPIAPMPGATSPTVTPTGTSNSLQKVVGIAVGNYHTCVLTPSEIKCDGWNLENQIVGNFSAVVAGDFYTCMLTANGEVRCMGKNSFGQLGDGTTTDRDTPVDVVGLTTRISALAAGDNHTCALMMSGRVKCWGRNFFGQLGNGMTAYSLVPVDVKSLSTGVVSLIAGNDHTCAIMKTGEVKCWGANESGQLGDGSLTNQLKPVDVEGLPGDVIALSAGFAHTCALTSQGQVLCWGDNSYGQLGDGNHAIHTTPVIVPGLDSDIVKVATGNGFTCVLTSKSGVKCWGRNDQYIGQLGDSTEIERFTPADVIGLTSGVVDIAAGNVYAAALLQNGRVTCWGMTWFCYSGPETQFGDQPTLTPLPSPTDTYTSPTSTPRSFPIATPAETTSLEADSIWGPVLLIVIGVLVFSIWRTRVRLRR